MIRGKTLPLGTRKFVILVIVLLTLVVSDPGLDAEEFERFLVPIFVTATPGQFNSLWLTEFRIFNAADTVGYYYPRGCDPEVCSTLESSIVPGGTARVFGLPLGPAQYIFLRNPEAAKMHMSAALVDLRHGDINPGISVPVLADDELRSGTVYLLNVPGPAHPVLGNLRVALRVFAVDVIAENFTVKIYLEPEPIVKNVTAVVHQDDPEGRYSPATAELFGIEGMLPPTAESIRIEVLSENPNTLFWATASVTNNQSQVVRLITPSVSGTE